MEVNELPNEEEEEKELANKLGAVGNALLSPPSSAEQLLPLLFELEKCLMGMNQSPSNCVRRVMGPLLKALTSQQLLYHLDVDVKVSVASCFIEIFRITAPDPPYDDENMKEIFKLIVAAFDNISDFSSCSYKRRVRILRTFASVKLWTIMLDLECNSLILQMFKHFLGNLRENHPEAVFLCMGFIMIMVFEEIDKIPSELLSPLLGCVRMGGQNVLPVVRKLCERVMENSTSKLAPYMYQAIKYTGFPLEDYGKIVAYICWKNSDPFEHEHLKVLASQDSSTGDCVEKSCNQEIKEISPQTALVNKDNLSVMQLSGKKRRRRLKINCLNDLKRQLSAKTSSAPDEDKHFVGNLTGSSIKVACSKEQKSCEGDIVSCDPLEKKQKMQDAVVSKEQCEYVGDESIAYRGKLSDLPILDTSCKLKPQINSDSLCKEVMREGTPAKKVDVKVANWDSAVESKNETDQSCSISEEFIVNVDRKLKDESSLKNEELPLKYLIPRNLNKLRSPVKENHGKSNWGN